MEFDVFFRAFYIGGSDGHLKGFTTTWSIPKFFAEAVLRDEKSREKLTQDDMSYDKWFQGSSSPRNHWANFAKNYKEDLLVADLMDKLIRDNDGNMELTDNLYLQESVYWEKFTGRIITTKSNQSELYFEEPDIERFVERLETLYPETEYVNRLMTHSWGQKVIRFYDPDGNLIEVGTPV